MSTIQPKSQDLVHTLLTLHCTPLCHCCIDDHQPSVSSSLTSLSEVQSLLNRNYGL